MQTQRIKSWKDAVKLFEQCLRFLYYPLLRFTYQKAAKRHLIVTSELEASTRVIQYALNDIEFVNNILEQRPPFPSSGIPWIQST